MAEVCADINKFPVLTYFNELFNQDPDIDEYGLIFGADDSELSFEQSFILVDHKLGISMEKLQPLFVEARELFMCLRKQYKQSGDSGTCEMSDPLATGLIQSTRALLMINPDQYTAWNTRKELILNNQLSVQEELKFLDLVFTKQAKKPSSWAHRTWCLRLLLSNPESCSSESQGSETSSILEGELRTCGQVGDRYPRNYYAWVHRSRSLPYLSPQQVEGELQFTSQWMRKHVSDYTCLNYRYLVLQAFYKSVPDQDVLSKISSLKAEFIWIGELIDSYPGHESLWYYRKALLLCWLDCFSVEDHYQGCLPQWQVLLKKLQSQCDSASYGESYLQNYDNTATEGLESKKGSEDDSHYSVAGDDSSFQQYEDNSANQVCLLIVEELELVRHAVADTSVWDYENQRKHAYSYQAFLAIVLQRWICQKEGKQYPQQNQTQSEGATMIEDDIILILNTLANFSRESI